MAMFGKSPQNFLFCEHQSKVWSPSMRVVFVERHPPVWVKLEEKEASHVLTLSLVVKSPENYPGSCCGKKNHPGHHPVSTLFQQTTELLGKRKVAIDWCRVEWKRRRENQVVVKMEEGHFDIERPIEAQVDKNLRKDQECMFFCLNEDAMPVVNVSREHTLKDLRAMIELRDDVFVGSQLGFSFGFNNNEGKRKFVAFAAEERLKVADFIPEASRFGGGERLKADRSRLTFVPADKVKPADVEGFDSDTSVV